jgi:hypothetical protein
MTTLLVTPDMKIGNAIADALEQTGEDVMWCRGPSGANCVCAAVRGSHCALTSGVDAVVVDTWLTSDQLDRGFRSSLLVDYYEGLGLPVVVLIGHRDVIQASTFGPRTFALPRHSPPTEVAAVVRGAVTLQAPLDETA